MGEFTDHRGTIRDVLEDAGSVTLITTARGAVRGNHYHEKTWQVTIVTSGALEMVVQRPGYPTQRFPVELGDAHVSPPGEAHAWRALSDSECMVFTVGPRSGESYESDTIRLDEPLI